MPDPSSQQVSSIGGNVATNAGGPHCLAYGVTPRTCWPSTSCSPTGRCAGRLPKSRAAGYDLRGVVVGARGRSGSSTALRPAHARAAGDPDDAPGLRDGARTARPTVSRSSRRRRARGDRDDGSGDVRAVEAFAHAGYPTDAAACCWWRSTGSRPGVDAEARAVEDAAQAHGVGSIRGQRRPRRSAPCSGRGGSPRSAPSPRSRRTTTSTTAWCPGRARRGPERRLRDRRRRTSSSPTCSTPATATCTRCCRSTGREPGGWSACCERRRRSSGCASTPAARSRGEHGIGLEKRDFMPLVFTEDDLAAQACVRSAFDPAGG